MRIRRKIFTKVFVCLIMLWLLIGFMDYWKVCHSFERPIFAIPTIISDDGGSGTYKGLGYSFEIKGNFMPEDEFPGVTHFEYYLFGKCIENGVRD